MRNIVVLVGSILILAAVASADPPARQSIGMGSSSANAAADKTPLLYDRVRTFPAVVVATLPDNFEKHCTPQPNTNGVFLVVNVEKVIKADKDGVVKPGPFTLTVHGELPKLLAGRDKAGSRLYLLAFQLDKSTGFLGSGFLYHDLERFFPDDAAMEKVVDAFIKVDDKTDDNPAALLKLCAGLLADPAMTDPAARHVFDLAGRVIALAPLKTADGKPANVAELQACVDAAVAAIKAGHNVPSAAAMLNAFRDRADEAADVKFDGPAVAESTRKWLGATSSAKPDAARSDWLLIEDMPPAIGLLGKLSDNSKSAKDVLVKIGKDKRWLAIRPQIIAAIRAIFGPDADAILKAIPQPGPMNPRLIVD